VDTDMTNHKGPLTIEQGKLKINFVSWFYILLHYSDAYV
jgi:hypothetical protein